MAPEERSTALPGRRTARVILTVLLLTLFPRVFLSSVPSFAAESVSDLTEGKTDGSVSDREISLIINEAVSYNSTYPAGNGVYYDWVEIKNSSDTPVPLNGYYLSDSKKDLRKYCFPDHTLRPGELITVFCTGDEFSAGDLCAPFSVSAGGEKLYLSRKTTAETDPVIIDTLRVEAVPLGGSIGRMPGENEVYYFSTPSPGKENANGFAEISAAPSASPRQGVYEASEAPAVTLTGPGEIYYTTDGSVPTEKSAHYVQPLRLSGTTVLRAVCIEPGKMPGAPATFSYIVGESDGLPVVSIACDPHEMFGFDGVYHADRANHASTDADVTFFDPANGFTSMCSVELHGANSRKTYNKKSFELKFSSRYGGPVKTDLFQTGEDRSYANLTLRGGALSRLELLRDVFVADLMKEVCPETYPLSNRYAVVYINAEYYGVYSWREVYKEEYFVEHTSAAAEEVELTRAPPLQCEELTALFNEMQNSSMAREENYNRISEKIDLPSYARWLAIQAFFNNLDISGNVRYVKRAPDAKWEVILYDLDYCCTSDLDGQLGWLTVLDTYQVGYAANNLLKNTAFRQLLLEETAKLCASGFNLTNILRVFEETVAAVPRSDVEKDCERWTDSLYKYDKNVESMRNHLNMTRYNDWLHGLAKLTGTDEVTMKKYFPDYTG